MVRQRGGRWLVLGGVMALLAALAVAQPEARGQFRLPVPPPPIHTIATPFPMRTIQTLPPIVTFTPISVPQISPVRTAEVVPLPSVEPHVPSGSPVSRDAPRRQLPDIDLEGSWSLVLDGVVRSFEVHPEGNGETRVYAIQPLDGGPTDRFPGRRWLLRKAASGRWVGAWIGRAGHALTLHPVDGASFHAELAHRGESGALGRSVVVVDRR